MNKFFPFFVLLSTTIILSIVVILTTAALKSPQKNNTRHSPVVEIYADSFNNALYSYGTCQVDSDCQPVGCSLETCSGDPSLITSCQLQTDHPNKSVYSCGCINSICAWKER